MVSPLSDNERALDLLARIRTDRAENQKTLKELEGMQKALNGAFLPDNAKLQQARQQFQRQREEIERVRKETERAADVNVKWGKALGDIGRANVIRKLSDDLTAATKSGENLDTVMERVKITLQSISASQTEVNQVVQAAANAANPRGGVGNQLLRQAGSELRGLPAIPIPGTSLTTETPARVLQSLGRLDVSLRDLAVGGGLALGATIALALAIDNYKKTLEPVETLIRNIVTAQREVAGLLAQNDPQSIVSRREEALAELTRLEAERNTALDQQRTFGRSLADRQVPDILGPLVTADDAFELLIDTLSKGPFDEATAAVNDYNGKIAAQQSVVDDLNKVIDEANRQLEAQRLQRQQEANLQFLIQQQLSAATIQTINDLNTRTEALDRERTLIEQTLATYYLSDEAQAKYRQRLDEINLAMGALDAVRPQVAQVEALAKAEKDRADAEQALLGLSERAIQIQEQGQQRLAALAEQSAKQIEAAENRLRDAVTKLADFETTQRDKRTELEADFMKSDLERTRKYRKDLEKLQKESDRRLLELLQDKEDAQFEATLQNDVSSFLRAERDFQRQSEREKSRLDVTEQDRLEAFNEESRRNQALLVEKIAAIDTETTKKREALLAEIAEQEAALEATKAQVAAKQAAEEAAIKKSLDALVKGLDTSTNAMVATIQQGFKILEAAGINTFTGIIGNLQSRAQAFYSSSNPASVNPTRQSTTSFVPGSTPLVRLTGFADGTLSTRAVFGGRAAVAAVNEHPNPDRDEAIIPYRRSVGLAAELQRMGAASGVTVNTAGMFAGAKIGGDVSQETLDALEQRVVNGTIKGVRGLVTGKVPA